MLQEGGDPFWVDVQEDYDAILPSEENRPPPRPEEVGDLRAEMEASGLFGDVEVRRHLWSSSYTPREYIAVLETYSGHRIVEERLRQRLYERIRRRIEALPAGKVELPQLATLTVWRRL